MRKLTIFFSALTLSVGLWAQETQMVSYNYPVYNTPNDPKSGIASWQTGSVEATVVESSDDVVYWGTEGQTSWYVVTGLEGYVQLTKGAVCRGYVHLILAGGILNASAEYNANGGAGIEVSGSNSLTIYGGANLNAVGGWNGAGIGGNAGSCSNITINGGTVTARAGGSAAGIGGGSNGDGSNIIINGGMVKSFGSGLGACIGGGDGGSGSYITINGGTIEIENPGSAAGIGGGSHGSGNNITINGGNVKTESAEGAAIGGGNGGQSSNIFVTTPILLKAGSRHEDAIETPHFTGYDMAAILKDKRYVKVEEGKATAYVEGYNAGKAAGIEEGKAAGKAEAAAELLGSMGEPCEDCPSVEVTKGTKTIRLYNPDKVEFKKE